MNKWDTRFLELAKHISAWSKDPSTKVGAVIVRPNRSVCSVGFNGFPSSMEDSPAMYANRDEKYSRIIHGEINAIVFAAEKLTGYTLYTYPFIPCDRCFVQVAQHGIVRVVAPKPTEDQMTRWGPAFERVRRYAEETGIFLEEVDWI